MADDGTTTARGVEILAIHMAEDTGLARPVRLEAERLRALALERPEVALLGLDRLAERVAPVLLRRPARMDLCRCVTVQTFLDRHADRDLAAFYDDISFRAHMEASADPDTELRSSMTTDEPLFPWDHCWLARYSDVGGMHGQELRRALGLEGRPPFVMFVLSRRRLNAASVTVRPARSVDAVLSRSPQWDPAGTPVGLPEFVDADVPHSALESVRWKP